MDNLTKLFESLDEKVFTADLKKSIETQFNEAVEIKATDIANSRIEKEIDSLNEKSEQHIELLNTKAAEYIEIKEAEMLDSVDKYLERVVEEFIAESKEALDESVKNEKADMIIEAFESMLTATGVQVSRIVEAKKEDDVETKLQKSIEKYDSLVEENIELKALNDKLIKMGVISEMKEGLSIVESEKFEKLAEMVEFTKDKSYAEKLETIKESVKGSQTEEPSLNEDSKDEPVWKRYC